MTLITAAMRNAVAGVIHWYDELLNGNSPTIVELQRALDQLRTAGPFPDGPVAADIARLLKPGPASARSDAIEALERLRVLSASPHDPRQLRLRVPFEVEDGQGGDW